MKSSQRIKNAISRLNNIEQHLLFVLDRRRGQKKLSKNTAWNIQAAIFEARNARTLLKNILSVEDIIMGRTK